MKKEADKIVPEELPDEAKMIFEKTYNRVVKGFESLDNIKGVIDKKVDKESAKEIAWIEVKRRFKKVDETWIKKE